MLALQTSEHIYAFQFAPWATGHRCECANTVYILQSQDYDAIYWLDIQYVKSCFSLLCWGGAVILRKKWSVEQKLKAVA